MFDELFRFCPRPTWRVRSVSTALLGGQVTYQFPPDATRATSR
jgi:hypothetical protein